MKKVLPFVFMTALLLSAVVSLSLLSHRSQQAERMLTEAYAAALYESAEDLQALAVTLDKTLISSDAPQLTQLLCRASQLADQAYNNLSFLPLSHEAMSPTLSFINQLADYATSLTGQIAQTGSLDQEALRTLSNQRTLCMQLGAQLALARQEMATDRRADVLSHALYTAPSAEDRPIESVAEANHGMEYPTLVYDGAFSDAEASGQPKGLTGTPITSQQAIEAACAFVGEDKVLSAAPAPNTSGYIPAFGVTVTTGDLQLNVDVTVQGGKILWMVPETASFTPVLSADACAAAADTFLQTRGFGQMRQTGMQMYDGLCVMSFAAVQDGVVLYPDTVKVQVRMDTGDVVGFEAHLYWMNHTERQLSKPTVTAEEAKARLSSAVSAEDGQLCITPWHGGERLCWEFSVRHGDSEYLIYLDAFTGHELDVKKVIPLNGGHLVA